MSSRDERMQALDEIATGYDPSDPTSQFDYWLKRIQVQAIAPWLHGDRVLELGCATGELATLLVPLVDEYVVVEGSAHNIEIAAPRLPQVEFVHALWEDYRPATLFSDVVLCNALEHSPDPRGLLEMVQPWLTVSGRVHIVVPNGLSLHRLVGVEMGLLPDPLELTDGDVAQGHLRNYTIDTLLADVRAAGLVVDHWQGNFVKLLPNRQMLSWGWDLISAVDRVARRLPEHAAELYLVARRPSPTR